MDDNTELERFEERFEELTTLLMATYILAAKLLDQMPIPVGIPTFDGVWNLTIAAEALERTRNTLVDDQPMPDLIKGLTKAAILEWLIAYEMGVSITDHGFTWSRIDAMDQALQRTARFMNMAEDALDIDTDPERE